MTMKNWLPDVPGGSAAVFAIATTPFVYFASDGGRPRSSSPGPPVPSPVRVAALDHEAGRRSGGRSVPSKKPFATSDANEAVVSGECPHVEDRTRTSPSLVFIVTV